MSAIILWMKETQRIVITVQIGQVKSKEFGLELEKICSRLATQAVTHNRRAPDFPSGQAESTTLRCASKLKQVGAGENPASPTR
jgi:hypothetical protein